MLRRRVIVGSPEAAVVAAAHQRAALDEAARRDDLAESHGFSALQQATAAGDPDLVARLLVEHGVTLLCAAKEDVVTAGLEKLPSDALDRFPQLLGVTGLHRRTVGDIAGAVLLAARASDAVQRLASRPWRCPRRWTTRCAQMLCSCGCGSAGRVARRRTAIASAHDVLGPSIRLRRLPCAGTHWSSTHLEWRG